MRDIGDLLLRVAATFVGGLLVVLACGLEANRIHAWGWILAVVSMPVAYAIKSHGEAEMRLAAPQTEQEPRAT